MVLSIVVAIVAVGWAVGIVRLAMATDDGGPPIAAIGAAFPALILLIVAGAIWPASRRNEPSK